MPISSGGLEQAFNAQAGVDMKTMLMVTNHVTPAPNDKEQLEPALTQLTDLPKQLGKLEALVADSGYFSLSPPLQKKGGKGGFFKYSYVFSKSPFIPLFEKGEVK